MSYEEKKAIQAAIAFCERVMKSDVIYPLDL